MLARTESDVMIAAEWRACTRPQSMIASLAGWGRVRERKWRLFAVACCGPIAALLDDPRSRMAVQVAEQYADGEATEEQRRAAGEAAQQVSARSRGRQDAATAAVAATETPAFRAADGASEYARKAARRAGLKGASARQAALLRDLFSDDPFRDFPFCPPSVVFPPTVLTWNEGLVRRLAADIYERRAFDRLPVLGDALEEAGCTDADILNHCRQPGEHVRGCWVVDPILGKS